MRTGGLTDLAGRVLAGRYRLLAPIGTGASGRVYVAWDTRLKRRVAVKALHAALADDAGFIRRFGAEAQVAASLNHPNIVTVYDWGAPEDEAETPFIVLELLDGGSLRGLLDRGGRLTPAQAAAVGCQVAAALEYAHARGLVHRDVKPANLLFDEDGTVRVADFGLARALAEASWTEPAGAVLGTARYAAPEQVQGAVDARSDLYSLALVLVEAVTGSVPFAAETSLATLFSRVDHPLEVPAPLEGLVPVLERAGRPRPEDRWPDAAAFGAALAEVAAGLPRPAPLPLAGSGAVGDDPHPTQVSAASGQPAGPAPAAPPPFPPVGPSPVGPWAQPGAAAPDGLPTPPSGLAVPTGPSAGPAPAMRPAPLPGPAQERPEEPPAPRRARPRRRLLPLVVVVLVLLAAAGAAFAIGRAGGPRVRVPGFTGRQVAAARSTAGRVGLEVRAKRVPADDPAGTVIRQQPAPGVWLGKGRPVQLTVSDGPPAVPLPEFTGKSAAEAQAALGDAGYDVKTITTSDETVGKGAVVRTEPGAGEPLRPGDAVTVVVSDGPKPVSVPDVEDESYAAAVQILEAKGFVVKRVERFSDDVDAGDVISQSPGHNREAPRGSTITLTVSKGPDVVTVPDVRGMRIEEAVALLEEAGFDIDVSGYRPGRRVKEQDPERDEVVRRGARVHLFL